MLSSTSDVQASSLKGTSGSALGSAANSMASKPGLSRWDAGLIGAFFLLFASA
ncbi:hypothetical protein [Corynebacterium alimapuense]|uniref:hypothetical protein n=1 Tax=Corynebacterium alimapuense TaxID=1576874 RepID=UPI001403113D|nr:hypothetical protein [Corynebacterium alimapuense]